MKWLGLILSIAIVTVATATVSAQQIHYVDASATGSNDGTSWANAFNSLQDALTAAASGSEIWVAVGSYRPDQGVGTAPGDRSLSFEMRSGVRLHGGFAGTETSKAERNLAENASVLTGDLAGDDDGFAMHSDNSFHVVRAIEVDDEALLDGFVIVGGNADGDGVDSLGGGILLEGGSPWIVNTRVNSSSAGCGGGIAVTEGGHPTIVNAVVNGNKATIGGGFCHRDAEPEIVNATVTSNYALTGPAVYNEASNPSIVNSIVGENRNSLDMDNCGYWQYPCSNADVPEEVRQRTITILEEAGDALESGSMSDAVAYLESQPDVVQTFGNSTSIAIRVRGGTLAFLSDGSRLFAAEGKTDPAKSVFAGRRPTAAAGKSSDGPDNPTIVGEDLNGDGEVNNRDGKRALIMSVMSTSTETQDIQNLLSTTRDYYSIELLESEDIGLNTFKSWDEYDFVYVSTVAVAVCDSTETMGGCTTHMVTATGWDPLNTDPGVYVNEIPGTPYLRTTITPEFFRHVYDGKLDNEQVYCAGCDVRTGGVNRYLTLGNDNFQVIGWTTHAPLGAVAASNVAMVGQLVQGVPWSVGVNAIEDLGLSFVVIPDETALGGGRLARSWSVTTSGDLGRRLIELPTLYYKPEASSEGTALLQDGQDITPMIEGVVGDNDPDILRILLTADGIDRLTSLYSVRFEVGGQEVPGEFSLETAQPVEGFEYRYATQIYLDLGFPVKKGILPIKAILDMPEVGSDSRYAALTTVDAFDCRNTSHYDGGRSGAFSGPANISLGNLTLESLDSPVASGEELPGPNGHHATFYFSPVADSGTTEFEILGGAVTPFNDPFESSFASPSRCGTCGGVIKIDSVSSDSTTFYGSLEFTGQHPEETFFATIRSKFKAMVGSAIDVQSPYFKCLTQYRAFWEATHR